MSFVAGVADRILLGTGVLLLPYRHPVVLAKQLATIDILSRGRLRMMTVGLGVLDGEAAAVGVAFSTRGRRADEAIAVLQKLWEGGADGVSHHGEFFAFNNVCIFPETQFGSPANPYRLILQRRSSSRRSAGRRVLCGRSADLG